MASTVLQRHVAVVEKQLDTIEDASPEQLQDTMRFLAPSRARGGDFGLVAVPQRIPRSKATARAAVLQTQHTEDGAGESTHPPESPGLRIEAVSESLGHIEGATSIGNAASSAMGLGVLSFFEGQEKMPRLPRHCRVLPRQCRANPNI
ncbi:hypothetical protein B0H16DRAFT_1694628 [Mycena metata]|uniref:Uncharacterized protein n=1 Tax=Mycena metata TaxID=1033252 RepID=A0AAD7ICM3_9AGAR|nr:hypothetical protein B0H16DRAFT_1694628 [Mycena metata]